VKIAQTCTECAERNQKAGAGADLFLLSSAGPSPFYIPHEAPAAWPGFIDIKKSCCSVEKPHRRFGRSPHFCFRRKHGGEVEKSAQKQISRLAFGSLEMTF